MTEISAPAGSAKTLLLRSWIAAAGRGERAGWVAVHGEERDPQRFWLSVFGALRETAAGSRQVAAVSPQGPSLVEDQLGGGEEPDGRAVQVGASHRISALDVA